MEVLDSRVVDSQYRIFLSAPGEGPVVALGYRRLQRRRRVRSAVFQAHRLRQVGEKGYCAALQTKTSKFVLLRYQYVGTRNEV